MPQQFSCYDILLQSWNQFIIIRCKKLQLLTLCVLVNTIMTIKSVNCTHTLFALFYFTVTLHRQVILSDLVTVTEFWHYVRDYTLCLKKVPTFKLCNFVKS